MRFRVGRGRRAPGAGFGGAVVAVTTMRGCMRCKLPPQSAGHGLSVGDLVVYERG